MTQPNPLSASSSLFKLEYPQSVGVYDTYADAQKAVDQLAEGDFPVNNLAIVGTADRDRMHAAGQAIEPVGGKGVHRPMSMSNRPSTSAAVASTSPARSATKICSPPTI